MSEGLFGFLRKKTGPKSPDVQPKPSGTGSTPDQEQKAYQKTAVNLVKEGVRVPETRKTAQREAAQETERLKKMIAEARKELQQEEAERQSGSSGSSPAPQTSSA